MMDLTILRHLWTEAGARDVFAELVTQGVRSIHPKAYTVRPAPGDDGVDVAVGDFGEDQRVWQAKYFCDGLGTSQRKQITKSWNSCTNSKNVTRLVEWTLCLPVELSIADRKWWDTWRRERQKKVPVQISLWTKANLLPLFQKEGVRESVEMAFREPASTGLSFEALMAELRRRGATRTLQRLPSAEMYGQAVFVRKLELAGVRSHLAKRTAFYNFDLLRHAVEQSGDEQDIRELEDLLVRVLDLWETEFTGWGDPAYGRKFVGHVDERIEQAGERLATRVVMQSIHKKGALCNLADLCEAWWTAERPDFGKGG